MKGDRSLRANECDIAKHMTEGALMSARIGDADAAVLAAQQAAHVLECEREFPRAQLSKAQQHDVELIGHDAKLGSREHAGSIAEAGLQSRQDEIRR